MPRKGLQKTKLTYIMKRHLLFAIATLVCCGMLFAAPRSEQQALQEAVSYLSSSSHVSKTPISSQALSLGWTAKQANGEPAFYVFNHGEGEGFVIVSADDNTRTVLGYADNGAFDEAELPSNTRAWLDRYARAVGYAASLPASSVRKAPAQQEKLSYTAIDPICKTTWDQGAPYNNKCPLDGSKRSVTGCVATAAAQVMKVHNHPTKGTGSHSYEWTSSSGTTKTLSANFGNTTYDWANMLNDYPTSTSGDATQRNAVATLMYHCGVSCEMGYTSQESGASGDAMMNALVDYFGYDPAIRTVLLDYMGEKGFLDALVADLQIGHPVYFTAFTPSGGGHAFVCDGIDADGLVHINWGWGGVCDGNFVVTVLNPAEQGIGGSPSNDSYTEWVTAYTQIQPNANGKPSYTITVDEMAVESKRVSRNDPVIFNASVFRNQSISTWSGSTVLMVYKNGSLFKTFTGYTGMGLDPGYYYTDAVPMYGYLSSLSAGEYEIVPGVGVDDQPNVYVPVYVQGYGEYRCPMTVTSSEIIIGEPQKADVDPTAPSVDELAAQFDVNNKIVLAVKFEEQVCNDVVFAGTYNNWKTDPSSMLRFEPLDGHDNWYVVEVPYASGAQGKPVQLQEDGTFSWDYQSGDVNAWIYQGGNKATITAGYENEADVAYPSAGAYIYKVAYWKNHNIPCTPEPIEPIYINQFDTVVFADNVASKGWWQIQALSDKYYITLSNYYYIDQVAGTYTVADLDAEYSYIEESATEKKITLVEGSVTLTVDAKTSAVIADGTFTGDDGNVYKLYIVYGTPSAPGYTVIYLDVDEKVIESEEVELHIPEAPEVDGFTFICWQPVASDISKGLFIQAIYEYNGASSTAPDEVVVPGDKARKLVREGNIYILREEKMYNITGQKVK